MFGDWRRSARLTALAAVSASCLMVTACGASGSGGAGGVGGVATASATTTVDPLASVSANKIATEALADLKSASNLTLGGSFTDSGQAYTLDLGYKAGKGCTGSIGEGSKGSFKLIVIGKTLYLNPDKTFWETNAGSSADTVIALVNGRYIKTTTSGNMADLAKLCDLSQLLASFKIDGTLTKGDRTTVGGAPVLTLSEGTANTMLVTDTAKPVVLDIKSTADASGVSGDLTFSTKTPVTLTAPPASDVIEGSAIGVS